MERDEKEGKMLFRAVIKKLSRRSSEEIVAREPHT